MSVHQVIHVNLESAKPQQSLVDPALLNVEVHVSTCKRTKATAVPAQLHAQQVKLAYLGYAQQVREHVLPPRQCVQMVAKTYRKTIITAELAVTNAQQERHVQQESVHEYN